jgi:hypothetical protein
MHNSEGANSYRTLRNRIEGSHDGIRRAASLPLFLGHGRGIYKIFMTFHFNFKLKLL